MASADVMNAPKSPLVGENLARRVLSYSLVSNLVQRTVQLYGKAKESNSIVKSALETGETLANKTLTASQPILATVDKYGKIEERSLQMLNSIEKRSADAVATIKALDKKRSELQSSLVTTVTTSVAGRLEPIVARVESYLPIVEEIDLDEVPSAGGLVNAAAGVVEANGKPIEPVQRIQNVTNRIQRVAKRRIQRIGQISRENFLGLRQVAELIEYARNHADVRNLHVTEVGDKMIARVHDAKELLLEGYHKNLASAVNRLEQNELVQKFEAAVGPHLAQLKDQSSRALLVLISVVGASVDFIHKEIQLAFNNDWNTAIANAIVNAKAVVATIDHAAASRALQLSCAIAAAYNKLNAERIRITEGTWNYLTSFRILIAVQSQLRDALVKAGINPNTVSQFLLSSRPEKKIE